MLCPDPPSWCLGAKPRRRLLPSLPLTLRLCWPRPNPVACPCMDRVAGVITRAFISSEYRAAHFNPPWAPHSIAVTPSLLPCPRAKSRSVCSSATCAGLHINICVRARQAGCPCAYTMTSRASAVPAVPEASRLSLVPVARHRCLDFPSIWRRMLITCSCHLALRPPCHHAWQPQTLSDDKVRVFKTTRYEYAQRRLASTYHYGDLHPLIRHQGSLGTTRQVWDSALCESFRGLGRAWGG